MTALDGGELAVIWQNLAKTLIKPSAILMISAHFYTRELAMTSREKLNTIHDFYGFPEELYKLFYDVKSDPALSLRIQKMLQKAGISCDLNAEYGIDHGAWVPLRTLFPEANIPVLQLSVVPNKDAQFHYQIGQALSALADENVLIIASGHMTHNLRDIAHTMGRAPDKRSVEFSEWIAQKMIQADDKALLEWQKLAPHAHFAHPTSEHFLPLFVALGARKNKFSRVDVLGGGFVDESLAADCYAFYEQ